MEIRKALTVLAIATSTACALLALSAASKITDYLSLRTRAGVVVSVWPVNPANGWELRRADTFTPEIAPMLRKSYQPVQAASAVSVRTWERMEIGEVMYRPRRVLAVDVEYGAVVGLRIVAGRFLDESDVRTQERVAVISEEVATVLFGSADAAVGNVLLRHYRELGVSSGSTTDWWWDFEQYRVIGVYADPIPVLSEIYGIGDIIVPVSRGEPVESVYARVAGAQESDTIEPVRTLVENFLGEANSVAVWLGMGGGVDNLIRHTARQTARITLFFGIIAAMGLTVAAIGFAALMTVENLTRERRIGIQRALGATRTRVVLEGAVRAVRHASVGLAIGIGGSIAASPVVLNAVLPILYVEPEAFEAAGIGMGVTPGSITLTGAIVVVTALLSGAFPVLSVVRAEPADQMRS